MKANEIYGDNASPDLFSHFEQAWAKTSLREWLQWNDDDLEFKNSNTLNYFYKWVTEDNPNTGQKKLTAQEVRDKLSIVISSEIAN